MEHGAWSIEYQIKEYGVWGINYEEKAWVEVFFTLRSRDTIFGYFGHNTQWYIVLVSFS